MKQKGCTGQERSEFVIYEAKMLWEKFRFTKPTNMRWWQLHHRLQSLLHKLKGIRVPLHVMISESPCGCSSIRVLELSTFKETKTKHLKGRNIGHQYNNLPREFNWESMHISTQVFFLQKISTILWGKAEPQLAKSSIHQCFFTVIHGATQMV